MTDETKDAATPPAAPAKPAEKAKAAAPTKPAASKPKAETAAKPAAAKPKKAKAAKGATILIGKGLGRKVKHHVQVNGRLTTLPVGEEVEVSGEVLNALADSNVAYTLVSEASGEGADNVGSSAPSE